MNAKDLDNIHWTLTNGQTHERLQLLSLISQIVELTSNAVSNGKDGSLPRTRGKTTDDCQRGVLLQHKQTSNENSKSNGNISCSTLQRGKSIDIRRGSPFQHMWSRHSQHGRTSPALEDGQTSLERQPDQTHTVDVDDDEMCQHGRTSQALEDGQTSLERQPDQTHTDNIDDDEVCQFTQTSTTSNSALGREQISSNTNEIDGNSQSVQIPTASSSVLGLEQTSSDTNKFSGNIQASSRNNGNSFDLNELLKSDVCADVVAYYEEHGRLDDDTRKQFMRIMRDELLKGPRVSNEFINRIASDVCLVFLSEEKTPYYDQQPGSTPTGIFYNMYRNKLKKCPPKNPRKRKAQDPLLVETNDLDEFSDKIKESVNYFKSVHEEDNYQLVLRHWTVSYSYRRAALRKKTYKNVTYILDNWPILKTRYGYHLINFDFEDTHGPLCAKALRSNWSDVARISDELYKMISNKRARSSIAALPSKDTLYVDVALAKVLHYLVSPRAMPASGLNHTPTMENSQKSFYQFAISENDLDVKIEARKEFWRVNNIEPHPIIFGVNQGSRVRYVVIMTEIRFYFHNFLNAFDAAFKIFHFFNIPYPPESFKFWCLINALFYKVNSDVSVSGKLFSTIQTLKFHITKAKKPLRRSSRSPVRP